jgi:hypothetical protein
MPELIILIGYVNCFLLILKTRRESRQTNRLKTKAEDGSPSVFEVCSESGSEKTYLVNYYFHQLLPLSKQLRS